MTRTARRIGVLLAMTALVSCKPEEEPPAESVEAPADVRARATYPPAVVAQIDSGNAAYTAGNYEEALRHYRAAADAGPEIPATWFGIYMAHHALGNMAAADSAMERVRSIPPGTTMPAPGAPDSVHR